jgi:hypothetical protein
MLLGFRLQRLRKIRGNLSGSGAGPLEIEIDLWEEVRRLLPLLEACEQIEGIPPGLPADQNGDDCPSPE